MKKILVMMTGLTVLSACNNDEITNENNTLVEKSFTAVQESQNDATRAYINGTSVMWDEGDEILVSTEKNNLANKFTLKAGSGTTTATFTGMTTPDAGIYYALYPYKNTYLVRTHDYAVTLPVEQTPKDYRKKVSGANDHVWIDPSAMLMIAKTENSSENFAFKNACAFVKIYFASSINSISFRSNVETEYVAGDVYLDYNNGDPIMAPRDDKEPNKSHEVTISAEGAGTFYIALRPQTFSNGFTIKVVTKGGKVYERTTDKEVTLPRNKVLDLGSYDSHFTGMTLKE